MALSGGGADISTPLWVAAFHGHIDVVRRLVSVGADVNLKLIDGSSPLIIASQEGHTDCVRLLVQHGAEVDARDNEGATPLYSAASNGHIEVVQFLIEQHADVNAFCSGENCLQVAAFHGHTSVVHTLVSAGADVNLQRIDGASPLSVASQEGQTDCVKLLVQCGAEVETRDNEGATPLYWAAWKGQIEDVQFLIEQHADVNACCSNGESCLCAAAFDGHTDVVRALVTAGANVNLRKNDGFSVLAAASQEGHIDCVKLLIQHGAEVDARNNEGATPLYWASANCHIEVVQFLIEQHADVNACCSDGQSCLWTAAFDGHTALVHTLVSAGADVNLQKNDGFSALAAASQEGHIDSVRLLIQHGAEVDTRSKEGATPLYLAASKGHIEVVQFLIEQHADVNACCSDRKSCLYVAAFDGHTDVVDTLVSAGADVNLQRNDGSSPLNAASHERHIDCVKLLIQHGAEVETRDNEGATPLYWAAWKCHIEVVQFLIEQHADINACHSSGESCLWAAAFVGHTDVVRALVSAGADVNLHSKVGFSPLTTASQEGHTDCVKLLIQHGAEVDARTNQGETPLYWAANRGHIEVVQFLIEKHADVNACCSDGESCLWTAAFNAHTDVVRTLVSAGADVNLRRNDGSSPLTAASQEGLIGIVMMLLDGGAVIEISDNDGRTTLPSHAAFGKIGPLYAVIACGADVDARNVDNLQAIDIAGYCGRVDIVKFLCDRFTCVKSSRLFSGTCIDYNCNTAMHLTTDVQCIRSLLENGADVEAENVDGLRPIHCAVRTGLVELVELLIQHGANIDAADVYGNTPLHEAVSHGLNVVQLLVEHRAKVNVQNVDGKTPLHVAVERQQSEVAVFLLNAGADVGLTDVWRNTALHYLTAGQLQCGEHEEFVVKQTIKYQHLSICNAVGVTALLSMAAHEILGYANHKREISNASRVASQADLHSEQLSPAFSSVIPCIQDIKTFLKTKVYCRKELEHVDCYGNTPLHHAVGVYGHLKMYRVSTDVIKTVEFLVERGADINARNNDGLTPLHVARGKQAIEACLQHVDNQSFTVTDKRGRNFWHLLFILRNLNKIELATNIRPIMSTSDSKHNSDDLNRTSLHYACMRNVWMGRWSQLRKEFIQEFSDEYINKQDKFGRTALHYAGMANNTELIDLLKTKTGDITVQDKFKKTADEYRSTCSAYELNVSLLDTSSLIARKFHSISLCIQQCFSDRYLNLKGSKAELREILCNLQPDNATSYVLKTLEECRFDYSDDVVHRNTTALEQRLHDRMQLPDNDIEGAMQLPTMFAAIQSQVEEAMRYLAKEISDTDIRFACEVVLVGSAREGIKIGCCDEFDYNFVLTDLSEKCEVCYSPESPPGFVLLKASMPEYDGDLFDSNGILNTRIVKFKFESLVKQILSSLSFCEATGFEFIDPIQDFILPPGTTSTKVNTVIKLEFTHPVNERHVPHSISVDVVPALCFDDWWPEDIRREDLRQKGDCLIVFTQPQIKYPWMRWTKPHGFITFARAESRLLRESPRVIRAACMVVKSMSEYFCQYELFSSHDVKTALFWSLDEMERTNEFNSSSHYIDEVNGDKLLRWVRIILRRLLCFAAQDYVPSYFMPKCHQPVWLKERYLKQFHMRLCRHGLLSYTDLFSLNEQQSRDSLLKYIKSLFICSHLMYWTVLSDDDELKLFVPSAINPLMEYDVCTTLLPTD